MRRMRRDPLRKAYFQLQAKRMFEFERDVCRSVSRIVAVSEDDARLMRSMFGIDHVAAVPTGVDVDYFTPEAPVPEVADLVFVGSMDWMPNSDGMAYFVREVLPLIRASDPSVRLPLWDGSQGRKSVLAERDPQIRVTGTVPDVRPYLWGSKVSIVPLRIGGGTRLKIYEAMAARTAVVATTVGAEGLDISSPEHFRRADTPATFAEACLDLLADAGERQRMAESAWRLVSSAFSWDYVADCFERNIRRSLYAVRLTLRASPTCRDFYEYGYSGLCDVSERGISIALLKNLGKAKECQKWNAESDVRENTRDKKNHTGHANSVSQRVRISGSGRVVPRLSHHLSDGPKREYQK